MDANKREYFGLSSPCCLSMLRTNLGMGANKHECLGKITFASEIFAI